VDSTISCWCFWVALQLFFTVLICRSIPFSSKAAGVIIPFPGRRVVVLGLMVRGSTFIILFVLVAHAGLSPPTGSNVPGAVRLLGGAEMSFSLRCGGAGPCSKALLMFFLPPLGGLCGLLKNGQR